MVGSPCSPRDSQESSPAPQFKSNNFLVLRLLYGQFSHPYMTSEKTIALTIWAFVGKVISLLFKMMFRSVMEKAMATHSSTLAWKIPWMEEPVGCSPWGRKELDMTECLHFHFSLSFIGEGNGNPLQYSCLENPRDCRAWWAAVYGVAESWTRLKRLNSSSSRYVIALLQGRSVF